MVIIFMLLTKVLMKFMYQKKVDSNSNPIKIGEYNQTGSFGELALNV